MWQLGSLTFRIVVRSTQPLQDTTRNVSRNPSAIAHYALELIGCPSVQRKCVLGCYMKESPASEGRKIGKSRAKDKKDLAQ